MKSMRWQDGINALLGVWMFASPTFLQFTVVGGRATLAAWILGLAIVVFAALAIYMPKAWEEALNIILGVCLLASPWALGYADQGTPTRNAVIIGLLVTGLAVWAMLKDTTVQKWWHERRLPH
jgi:SPW repeat